MSYRELVPHARVLARHRQDVQYYLNRDLIQALPLLHGMDDRVVLAVSERLTREVCMPGDTVVRQGDLGEEMYFIREGECECSVFGKGVVKVVRSGDFFGGEAHLCRETSVVHGSLVVRRAPQTAVLAGDLSLFASDLRAVGLLAYLDAVDVLVSPHRARAVFHRGTYGYCCGTHTV